MKQPPKAAFRPRFDTLESRDTPSASLFTESFDQTSTPSLPAGWTSFAHDRSTQFISSGLWATSGSTSLASLGDKTTGARFWNAAEFPADTGVAASVKSGNPAPILVIARGQNLDTLKPRYLGAVVRSSGRVDLVEVSAGPGTTTTLATINMPRALNGPWLRVTLRPVGTNATVQVQRLDTGEFLNRSGKWQREATDALQATVTQPPTDGYIGIGRWAGQGEGMAFIDDVAALAPPAVNESFNRTAVGNLPVGWQSWRNDDAAGFQVTTDRAFSPSAGLASGGRSSSSSRAWVASPMPADVQASVVAFTDTLAPLSLFVRGANLNTAAPTYYGLSVRRGLTVDLTRVVDGVPTTLGSVTTADYVSWQWVRLTLTADGDQLRAVVYRTDTKQWLSSDGRWQDWPDSALEVTDTLIPNGGFVGVGRGASVAGTVTFDDFEVRPADAITGPAVTVQASQAPGAVVGDVTFSAATSPVGAANRVEFRLDGVLKAVSTTGSGQWTLDTTLLGNGAHTLTVRAVDGSGNVGIGTLAFNVVNPNPTPAPTRPDLPRHYDHIRIAQLAYNGTPMSEFELQKLRDSVDLLIPNPKYLEIVDQTSPDTPQLVYSNISNLYGGLLTDWLNFADSIGASRELAFYHVPQPTAFSGASPSSQPVNWFWSVVQGAADGSGTSNDFTAAARGGRNFNVGVGGAGDALSIGYTDKFREINFDFALGARSNWQGVLEYAAAVDANGNVTQWKQLSLLSDATSGLAQSGRVTFDPPSDWVAGSVPGGGRYYYVRVRAVSGVADCAPQARTILGRDFVNANGTDKGVIPAFDYAADKNGDGYLSDVEYANRKTGFEARFAYEGRLFYPFYGQMRFATNPASSAIRRWAADVHTRLLESMPLADGVFLDNSSGKLPFAGQPVIEPIASYSEDAANLVLAVWKAVAPKLVFTNTVGGTGSANAVTGSSTGAVEEFLLRPMEATWSQVYDAANLVAGRLAAGTGESYVVLDTHPAGSSFNDPRTKLGALAYYYLLADPQRTMIMFFGGFAPAAPWSQTWIEAAAVDVGQPTGAMSVFATGSDPQNAALTYNVFGRQYGNGLTLYKPRSYTLGVGTGTLDDATATTHGLDGQYYVVSANGTVSTTPVTQVTLRNGEGAILIRA